MAQINYNPYKSSTTECNFTVIFDFVKNGQMSIAEKKSKSSIDAVWHKGKQHAFCRHCAVENRLLTSFLLLTYLIFFYQIEKFIRTKCACCKDSTMYEC